MQQTKIVTVTGTYVGWKLIIRKSKPIAGEIIDVERPDALVGQLVIPNRRIEMTHFIGRRIRCCVCFEDNKPIRLSRVRLITSEGA